MEEQRRSADVSSIREVGLVIIQGLSVGIGAVMLVVGALAFRDAASLLAVGCGVVGIVLMAFGMWEPEEPQP